MSGTVTYRGDQVYAALERRVRDAVRRSAVLLHTRSQQLVNKPTQKVRKKRQRTTAKGKKGSQYTAHVGVSKPGEPPRTRTTHGREGIKLELASDGMSGKVGPSRNAQYMAFLQLGTRHIAPRPWLTKAISQAKPAIKALLEAAMKEPGA